MLRIKFKNLDPSEMAREAAIERINTLIDKFSDLATAKIDITLEMQNSPIQAGPDAFVVKILIHTGRYKGISVSKTNSNLYIALAELVDNLLEKLNRFGDKTRIKQRNNARKLVNLDSDDKIKPEEDLIKNWKT